jgi:RNA polymerase sigma factor (sigma-70 family)
MPGIRLAALVRKLRRPDPPDLGGRADADLLARFAANRDEAAFELLVWRHGAMVLASCRRVLGHTEDAEDAFQAAFLVLARKAASVRGSVPAWLHRVAVRIALKVARKRRPTAALELDPVARSAPDSVELGDLRGLLDAEIDRLSEPCRRAFVLCYLEGLSNADAARLIGCPVGTVESRLTAARKKLRDRLARRNVELPAGALALLGAQSGLAKEAAAVVARGAVVAAERGVKAAVGIVREPAAKLAQGVLVMTKLRLTAGVSLGVALLGLAAGVGWANIPADPPDVVQPEVAAAEPEVARQPTPKDAKPGGAWPLARTTAARGTLLRIAPDGATVVSHSGSQVYGTSLVTSKLTYVASSDQTIHSVAISPDGGQIVTAEGVNGVKVRDAKTGRVVEGLWPTGDLPANAVGFSADGSKFVVICSRTSSAFGVGGPFGAAGRGKDVPPEVRAKLADRLKKATLPLRVSVWDAATRKELHNTTEELTGHNVANGTLTLAGHGRFVIKAELVAKPDEAGEDKFEARRFTIIDPFAKKTKATVDVTEWNVGMFGQDALSPDGGTLALLDATGGRNTLRFVDTATGKDRFRPPAFRRPLRAVAFSQDGRLVAASTGVQQSSPRGDEIAAPSEVVIWEVATGKEMARLVDQDRIRDQYALAFSPDGSFLVSQNSSSRGSGSAELQIWGTPPAAAPEPEPVKTKPKVTAGVPERFTALFVSLAADGTDDAKRVESLFLAALGRLPSDVESRTLVSQLAKRSDKAEAMKDLLGTLVETAEFKAHAEALGRLAK